MEFKKKQDLHKTPAKPTEAKQPIINLQQLSQQIDQLTRPEQLPQRITLIQQALQLVDQQTQPELWIGLQIELGNSLAENPSGNRANNLELAIKHYQQALVICPCEFLPKNWADIQNNLANVYQNRIKGNRINNLEQSIHYYEQTLLIYTPDNFPQDWARTHNNLGVVYKNRIKGSRVENLERAIYHYQLALSIYFVEVFPEEWATTQNNLAVVYVERIRGSHADNLELSIYHCQQCLTFYAPNTFPQDWAMVQTNLANAYKNRVYGSREDNVEQSIYHYQQALNIRTYIDFPRDWALTQNNLGNAYQSRVQGNRAENLEVAIYHYQQALTVRTQEAFPDQWATTQNNLGNAYFYRIQGNKVENLYQAIHHYQQVLTIRTREAFPEQWATAQNNLGNIYSVCNTDDKLNNLELAVQCYQHALAIKTPTAFPRDHRMTQRNLGHLYFDNERWAEVNEPYQAAISVGKQLLKLALTPESQQAEIRETAELFARASYASLKTGQVGSAFFTLEQGKTQLLTQALALYKADVSMLTEAQKAELHTVREGVRVLETELRLPEGSPGRLPTLTLTEQLQQARTELDKVIDTLRGAYPTFMPEGFATLEEVLAVIPPHTTVIAPVVTSHGAAVLVVPHGVNALTESHVLWLPTLTNEQLNQWLYGTAEKPGWLKMYTAYRDAEEIQRNFRLKEMLSKWADLLQILGQEIILPIRQKLAELNIAQDSELLFLPQAGLGLLPLHACLYQWEGVEQCLTAEFNICYTPSLYALQTSQERLEQTGRQAYQLLACINPTGDLPFTPFEGHTLDQLFTSRQQPTLLWEKEAKKQAVVDHLPHSNYFHFSGHGTFGWGDVQQSGLKLADKQRLTMTDILTKLNLEQMRLVVLSACETGITDLSQNRDEFLGLPAAFLQAGSPAVLSTLWAVNDLSTTLFMQKFYEQVLNGVPLAEAVRHSQLWLRTATAAELSQLATQLLQAHQSKPLEKALHFWQRNPTSQPFSHPYYWACFVLNGV